MGDRLEREFVDTNVLVYANDTSAGIKRERAQDLVSRLWVQRAGCVSIQVLQELYVNLTRKVPRPLDGVTVSRIVSDLSRWQVHSPEPPDLLVAIEIHQRNRISFWDAMIVRSAVRLGCARIWSEDLNSGQAYEGIVVQNPFS
jgi:predicted nucleic acid-binding protein